MPRAMRDDRPEFDKEVMLHFLGVTSKLVVKAMNVDCSSKVTDEHVNEVYGYLWQTSELKFASEIHLNGTMVLEYLWTAANKNKVK